MAREACKNFPSTLRNDEHDDDACCLREGKKAGGRGSGIEVFKFRSKEGGNERRDGTSSGSNAAEVCTVILAFKACCSGS